MGLPRVGKVAIINTVPYPARMETLSPATRLIAACCRRRDDPRRAEAIAGHLGTISDWDGFLAAVKRHRVHAHAHDALSCLPAVPSQVIGTLRQRTTAMRVRGLRQISELVRVTSLLQGAGIPAAEIKGITLGVLAYGRGDLKESVDLDLLVSPLAAIDAVHLLLAHGYSHKQAGTALRTDQLRAVIRNRKDIVLFGPGNTKLELHWRLSHVSGLLDGAGDSLAWQPVEVAAGQTVQTIAMPDLVSYLAVHGALSDWARLKWLADFDALFRPASAAEKSRWIEHAQALGAARCLYGAMAVSEQVIGPYEDAASREIARAVDAAPATRRALLRGLRCIAAPYPAPRATLSQKIALVCADFSAKLLYFRRLIDARTLVRYHLFVEKDILRFPLPDRLRYLYPLIRGLVWAADRFRPVGRKLAPAAPE